MKVPLGASYETAEAKDKQKIVKKQPKKKDTLQIGEEQMNDGGHRLEATADRGQREHLEMLKEKNQLTQNIIST